MNWDNRNADMPLLSEPIKHTAQKHLDNASLVPWNSVQAVADACRWHLTHYNGNIFVFSRRYHDHNGGIGNHYSIVIAPNETNISRWLNGLKTFPAIDNNYSLLPSYVNPTIDKEAL
jgi:hypothetical protein